MNSILPSRQPNYFSNPTMWLGQLKQSLPYLQADPASRRRMEENVSKGLPSDIDPQRVFVSGFTSGYTPIYSAALGPSGGFGGGWGSIGMDREPKSTGKLQAGAPLGSAGSSGTDLARRMRGEGGPQPAESTPTPAMPSGGSPLSFTGFGGMMRKQEEEMNRGLGFLTGFGGIPRFPFSNY